MLRVKLNQMVTPSEKMAGIRSVPLLHLLLAALLISLAAASGLQAQEWRASAGYSLQHFDFDFLPNSAFDGEVGYTQKGMLELEVERYLLYRFYIAGTANVLLHNQETVFIGGPVDFQQANIGIVTGMQWSRIGLYAGVQAGRIWNLNFRGHTAEDDFMQIAPAPTDASGAWVTGVRGGVKYYLMRYLRLQVEVVRNYNMPDSMEPLPGSTARSEVDWGGFNPYSVRAGFSISIPWHGSRRLERLNRRDRLPLTLESVSTNFSSPIRGNVQITSAFGSRWGRNHEGVDLQASRRDAVVAAANGVVTEAGRASGYGRTVVIRHSNGYTTRYAHLHRIRVRQGQTVRRGNIIGSAGSSGSATGVHLHFEIRQNGRAVDPQRYIRF